MIDVWLDGGEGSPDEVAALLDTCSTWAGVVDNHLAEDFDHLYDLKALDQKIYTTSSMLEQAYMLASGLWAKS